MRKRVNYSLERAKKLNKDLHRRTQAIEGEVINLRRRVTLMLEDRQNWIKTADLWCDRYWKLLDLYNKLKYPKKEVPKGTPLKSKIKKIFKR